MENHSVSSNSLPVKALKFEPAGQAFHSAALRLAGYCDDDADGDDQSISSDDKEQTYVSSFDSYRTKSKKKSGADGKQQDHYAFLGLAHLRYLATEEQIRKSYREIALNFHPDKQASLLLSEETEATKQAKKDEIENHFKAIQEAYEVLIDPQRRRIYDSTDEFDDEIPTDSAPQDFFRVFGPIFMRISRWSVTQPTLHWEMKIVLSMRLIGSIIFATPSKAGGSFRMQMNLTWRKLNLVTLKDG